MNILQRVPRGVLVGVVVLMVLVILALGGIVLLKTNKSFSSKLSNIPVVGNAIQGQQGSKDKIELVSSLSNYSLNKGPGYDNLVKLIGDRGFFDKGLYVNKDSKYHPVSKLRIILNSTELDKVAIKYNDSGKLTTISAVDFGLVDNGTLELKVYVVSNDKGLGDLAGRDKIFSEELIRLIFLATAPPSVADSKMRVFDAEEADKIFNQNYSSNLPIKVGSK